MYEKELKKYSYMNKIKCNNFYYILCNKNCNNERKHRFIKIVGYYADF